MFREIVPFIVIAPPLAYGLITLWCGISFFSRRKAPASHVPPVSIIKPVKGSEADSLANFTSFCCQDYPCFQLIFALASPDDPALQDIRQLIRNFPAVDITLVVDERVHGPNYKVGNLINAYPEARHDIIVVCDSDVHVEPDYLRNVCAPFADPAVGVVTSLYRASRIKGIAGAIEAAGFSMEMIPNVLTARKLEGLSFALGASMAIRRDLLEQIGGFPRLANYLADDYQLGNRAFRAGYRVELADGIVEINASRESLGMVLSRQLRWARTMRVSRPLGYLASGITLPVPALLLALAISGLSPQGYGAASLLYAARLLVAFIYSRFLVRDAICPRWLWLLPVRDLIAFCTWALSFLGNRVYWRGHAYRIHPGGEMTEIAPE